ncbi:MAG: cytochrome d ubiquinol oxidase subunit II [Bifidobacteriaceae bacterium]|jgi:cytochrome d ubiquinol oxidase subunit II|nr:cytochrome d ubiquinol oxidase subunit II [Bifidobacteriaceae bacterium]
MLNNILALAPAAPVDPQVTEDTANGLVNLLHRLAEGPTGLENLWFILIAVLWTGYLVLEGFDFGVGMLLPIIGKKNNERRAMLSTIGPLWDGNEVWVLTAGGATFAAFPEWYATLFSAAYLPLFLILVGLIVRAVAFEYRGKINSDSWRKVWDWCIILGSWIPAILWGVAFANLVAGVKAAVDPAQIGSTKILYDGTFWDLVIAHKGFLLLGGLTTAALFMAHGAIFLSLKTDGVVRERAESLAPKLTIAATVIAAAWVLLLGFNYAGANHLTVVAWVGIVVAAVALVVAILTTLKLKFGIAFAGMTVALLAAVVTIFASLFPNVINGSRVTIEGEAIADPIVGAVVLDEVDLEDVVNITFDRVAADGIPEVPAETPDNAPALTVGILENVRDGVFPALGLIPQERVEQVVKATFDRVGNAAEAGGVDLAQVGVGVESSDLANALTVAVLTDVSTGTFPAAGVIPQENVEQVVGITFARVNAAVAAGALDASQIGVGAEPSELAVTLTVGVLDDVANGILPAAGVIPEANVVDVVKITLLRLGIEPTDAVVGAVVADLQANKDALDQLKAGAIQISDLAAATIAGLPADAVATEVARTVEALVPQLQITVEALVPFIQDSVNQVVNVEVPATLQAVADDPNTSKFSDEFDVTAIVTGDLSALNGRIDAANEALDALVALGLLGEHQTLEPFAAGETITGQPMHASASSPKTLTLMTWVAACLVWIVLLYQGWSIWVFRKRISADRIPEDPGL